MRNSPKNGADVTGTVGNYAPGIPRLAGLMNSDISFTMFRGFRHLAIRRLLEREIELDALESKLLELDRSDAANTAMEYRLHTVEHCETWDREKRDIQQEIDVKLSDYCRTDHIKHTHARLAD